MPLQVYHYNLYFSTFSTFNLGRKILKNVIPSLIVAIFLTAILRIFSILLGLVILIPLITGVGSVVITIIRYNILNLAITLKKCIYAFFLGVIMSCFVIYVLKPFILNLLLHKDIGLEIFIPIFMNDLYIICNFFKDLKCNMNQDPNHNLDPDSHPKDFNQPDYNSLNDPYFQRMFNDNDYWSSMLPEDPNGPNSNSNPIMIDDDDNDDLNWPNNNSDTIVTNKDKNTNETNVNPNALLSEEEIDALLSKGEIDAITPFKWDEEIPGFNEEYNETMDNFNPFTMDNFNPFTTDNFNSFITDGREEFSDENITESCSNNKDLNTDLLKLNELSKNKDREEIIYTMIHDPFHSLNTLDVAPNDDMELTPKNKPVYVKKTKGIINLFEPEKPVKTRASGMAYISAKGENWMKPLEIEKLYTDSVINSYSDHLKSCVKAYPTNNISFFNDCIFNNSFFERALNNFKEDPTENNLVNVRNMILHHYFNGENGYLIKEWRSYNASVIGTLYPSRVNSNLNYTEDETHVVDYVFDSLSGFTTAIVNYSLSSNDTLIQQVKDLNLANKEINLETTKPLPNKYIIMISGDTNDKGIYIRFFIHQDNYHRFNLNKYKDKNSNGYLGLYVNNKGIEIMPQEKNYKMQCIRLNLLNPLDRLSIHALFTYINNTPFRPTIDNKLILKDIPTVGHPSHHSHVIATNLDGSKVVLGHNGQMRTLPLPRVDNIARSMEDNWLNTYGSSQAQLSSKPSIRDNLREINKRKGIEDSTFNTGFNKRSKK